MKGKCTTGPNGAEAAGPYAGEMQLECPKCGGKMFDNRAARRQAQADVAFGVRTSPPPPAFLCLSRRCDGTIRTTSDAQLKCGSEASAETADDARQPHAPLPHSEASRRRREKMRRGRVPPLHRTRRLMRMLRLFLSGEKYASLDLIQKARTVDPANSVAKLRLITGLTILSKRKQVHQQPCWHFWIPEYELSRARDLYVASAKRAAFRGERED